MLWSGGGNDIIFGDEGRDVIDAGEGNDLIVATKGDGSDVIEGGLGIDTIDYAQITTNLTVDLTGSVGTAVTGSEHDTLAGIENVRGGLGHDTFIAGNGANVFEGGAGFDTFVFKTAAAANGDTINGFQTGDKIKLSFMDANTGLAGDQAFQLLSSGEFTAAGQLKMHVSGSDTILEGNVGGDNAADFSITIAGRTDITAADLDLTKVA